MSEQKQVQLSFFKELMIDFSYLDISGDWNIYHLRYSVKTGQLTVLPNTDTIDEDIDAGNFKIPVNTDIQHVVSNLITIGLTRVYDHGFDMSHIRILDVYEKGKK